MRAIRDTARAILIVTEAEIDEFVTRARDAIDRTAKDCGKM